MGLFIAVLAVRRGQGAPLGRTEITPGTMVRFKCLELGLREMKRPARTAGRRDLVDTTPWAWFTAVPSQPKAPHGGSSAGKAGYVGLCSTPGEGSTPRLAH